MSLKPHTIIIALVFCMLLHTVFGATTHSAEGVITIHSDRRVQGDDILLGEIATIQGTIEFISAAQAVVIGRSPAPGRDRTFHKKQILARLKRDSVDVDAIKNTIKSKAISAMAEPKDMGFNLSKNDFRFIFNFQIYFSGRFYSSRSPWPGLMYQLIVHILLLSPYI